MTSEQAGLIVDIINMLGIIAIIGGVFTLLYFSYQDGFDAGVAHADKTAADRDRHAAPSDVVLMGCVGTN
jgi:hypothetical protein